MFRIIGLKNKNGSAEMRMVLMSTPIMITQVVGNSRVSGMSTIRVKVWVASPEPAVGVFTTAGTCQGRLRRHS